MKNSRILALLFFVAGMFSVSHVDAAYAYRGMRYGGGDGDAGDSRARAISDVKKVNTNAQQLYGQRGTLHLNRDQTGCLTDLSRTVQRLDAVLTAWDDFNETDRREAWGDARTAFVAFAEQFDDVHAWASEEHKGWVDSIKNVLIPNITWLLEHRDFADAPAHGGAPAGLFAGGYTPAAHSSSGWKTLVGFGVAGLSLGFLLQQCAKQCKYGTNYRGLAFLGIVASAYGLWRLGKKIWNDYV